MTMNFLIAGTDGKMSGCKNKLEFLGHNAKCCEGEEFLNALPFYENIILPLPTVANGAVVYTGKTVAEIRDLLRPNQKVFFGNIPSDSFHENGRSYYYNEGFLIKNSGLTAQGVLKIILDNTQKDFHTLSVAVLGFGRCGKAICKLLKNCGFQVTSFSRRSESKILAQSEGLMTDDMKNIDDTIRQFDIIVNTVPFNIISENGLDKLTQENLYIETASKPYGFDILKSDIYSFRYVLGESLPGKFTPVSAGINIADTVTEMIKEGKYG